MNKINVLITGGAGFIGSWLSEALIRAGHKVTVVDNLSPQIHGQLPIGDQDWQQTISKTNFVRGDVRDQKLMDKLLSEVEAVVHLAAETGTGQSMYQIAHYYDVNQQATASLFEAIATRHKHITRVVLASSRSIYGEGAYRLEEKVVVPAPRNISRMQSGKFEPVGPKGESLELIATPEDVTPRPASVYAATKLANEDLGRIFAETYGVNVVALRFQNVYGERQSLCNPYTGILSIFSNRMRQNLPINIYEDGKESRDFVHVSDIVGAVCLTLESLLTGYQAINVGSGLPTTVMQIAETLKALLNSSSVLSVSGDFRAGDIRHCYADLTKAEELIGFKPEVSLVDGLNRFVAWVDGQQVLEDKSQSASNELLHYGLGRVSA
jgi:dTDP-L-rhamnose 4-epimerase